MYISSFRIFCSPIEELWNGTKFRPLRGGAQKGTKKNRTPVADSTIDSFEGSATARFGVRDFEIQWISGGFLDFSLDFWISVWISGFRDFRLDFWISNWISGFQNGFLDFTVDFWISKWISGFQSGFLDFTVDFWISKWISELQSAFLNDFLNRTRKIQL